MPTIGAGPFMRQWLDDLRKQRGADEADPFEKAMRKMEDNMIESSEGLSREAWDKRRKAGEWAP